MNPAERIASFEKEYPEARERIRKLVEAAFQDRDHDLEFLRTAAAYALRESTNLSFHFGLASSLYLMAAFFMRSGDPTLARGYVSRARVIIEDQHRLENEPLDWRILRARIYNLHGHILTDAGETTAALEALRRGMEWVSSLEDPVRYFLINNLANLYIDLGKTWEAESLLRGDLAASPRFRL
jgi:tetratricopeptide (TPR) repeat protein